MITWCNQVPVLGYNSGRYDLNMIKRYFVKALSTTTEKINVAAKGRKIIFINTPHFCFLDVMNYVGPGTSLAKWVTAYGCKETKLWFPYEWFDQTEKLDYQGLPELKYWHTSM